MGQIILNWGFPFYLIVLEMLFRGVSGIDTSTFIGPAIATAGLSFLLPLTTPKTIQESLHNRTLALIEANGGTVVNTNDQKLIPFIWLSILIGFLIWFWSSHVALTSPNASLLFVPQHVAIGFINYFLAAVLSALKGGL